MKPIFYLIGNRRPPFKPERQIRIAQPNFSIVSSLSVVLVAAKQSLLYKSRCPSPLGQEKTKTSTQTNGPN
jgi:hypothetical protein